MAEIRVKIDGDRLLIDDIEVLETGKGLHGLIVRVVDEVTIDGTVVETGKVPLRYLKSIGEAIGVAIKGLSDPNA
jgi:hypothetical protein